MEAVSGTSAPARQSHLRTILPIALDIALPLAAYYGAKELGWSTFAALLAGSGVALARVGYVVVRSRKFDVFAGFMVAVMGLGLALSFLTGDEKFLLAKESFGTAVAGLVFLGSCFVGRPLIFHAARRGAAGNPGQQEWFDSMWASTAGFRRTFTVLSAVWGIGLLADAVLRVLLVYTLPIDVMVVISAVQGIGTFALLMVWTFWYRGRAMARAGLSS